MHQQGPATFSESTGQPGQSKLHQVVEVGLRPQNSTTRTYVGPADIVLYSWAAAWALSIMTMDQCQNWAGGRTSSSSTLQADAVLGLASPMCHAHDWP